MMNGLPNMGWTANYETGEIFQDTTPISISQALSAYQANPNSLKARNNAFKAIRKENKDLSRQLIGNSEGYDAFSNVVKQAYQPKLLGVVPGLLGDSEATNYRIWGQQVGQQQQQQHNRQVIDNFMQYGDARNLVQPGREEKKQSIWG